MSFSSTPRWSLLGYFWLSFPLPQLVFYKDLEFQGALNICLVFQSWMAEESMFLTPISELRGGYCCLLPSSRKPLFILRMSSGSGLCGWVLDHQRGNSYCFNVSHSALISFVHWVLCSLDEKFKSIVMKFENYCCGDVPTPLPFIILFLLTKDLFYSRPVSLYIWPFILFRERNTISKSQPLASILIPNLFPVP